MSNGGAGEVASFAGAVDARRPMNLAKRLVECHLLDPKDVT
jgi:hypothetical protein